MDLKDYRELIKKYFHKEGFSISPEVDRDKVTDAAILNRIIREAPEVGDTIFGFAMQDYYFIWHSMYPTYSESEGAKLSRNVVDFLAKRADDPKIDRLKALEKVLIDNKDKIDYRRLLLNTVVSLQGATQYAMASNTYKLAVNKMDILRKDVIEKIREFRPHIEEPEIYLTTPPLDKSRSFADFTYINWDEVIERKNSKKVVDLGLTNTGIKNIESVLNLEDVRLIPNNYDCGKEVEKYLSIAVENADVNGNQIRSEDAIAIIRGIMRKPEYQRIISPEKYHFIALYRFLGFLEGISEPNSDDVLAVGYLGMAKKLMELIEKDISEGKKIDEPFYLFLEDGRENSKYRYNPEELFDDANNLIGQIDGVTIDDIRDYYLGVTREYKDLLVQIDSRVSIDLYQKGYLTLAEFTEYIKKADGKQQIALLSKAYDKKAVDEDAIKAIINDISSKDRDSIRKMGVAEIQLILQRVQSATYVNNLVLDEMLLSGIVNQDLLIEQYFNGMLKIEDLSSFARYIENSEKTKDKVECSKMKFDPKALAQVYIQLNLKNILNTLVNKEHFDKNMIYEMFKERPKLVRNCTPEQLKEFQTTFTLQRNLLKRLDEKAQKDFMEELGVIAYAQGIAFDLYDKGIISKYVGQSYGETEFIKQWQKTQLVDGLRYNDLASIKNLFNAYRNGRISLSKILRKYAEGEISPEIYFAFKEGRDMTEAIDTKYLVGLYDKYAKTGKAADLEILERYYREFKCIVKDEKLLEEINKKQIELISSKKNNKDAVKLMAKSRVIDKENIAVMDLETIAELIMSGNTLNRDTAKELFRDTDGTTIKRDKLEELFEMGILTQDEMFTVLSNVYIGNVDSSPEQQEIDANNMDYFFNKDYFETEYDEFVSRNEPTRRNRKNVGTTKGEQQRFPIKDRIEYLFSLDEKEAVNYKAGPAIILQLPGKNKVIIETLGTPVKKSSKIESDLTDHCTYILPKNEFENVKSQIFEERVATTKRSRKEIESVLIYDELIKLYNHHRNEIGMKRIPHKDYWRKALADYFKEKKPEDVDGQTKRKKKIVKDINDN